MGFWMVRNQVLLKTRVLCGWPITVGLWMTLNHDEQIFEDRDTPLCLWANYDADSV